ncbi:MAG: 23S rRNA (adenine(2503)-C(2))-methyltransferase RlmN [Planctomycetota bacterium]
MKPDRPEHLLDHPPNVAATLLEEWFASRQQPGFRCRQALDHLFERRVAVPEQMSNLPGALREELGETLLRPVVERVTTLVSEDGTRKYGFKLHDGALIESVWIPTPERGTLCVSSQAGCPAGCTFCATAAGGFRRNLAPSEIVGQWLEVVADLEENELPQGVTQIVFMGMGEPLLNYPNLNIALRLLTGADGFSMSPRRITVSTVGFVDRMTELLEDFPRVRLALSLHSAVDETRGTIVPVNRKHNVASLRTVLETVRKDARRITLEYVLLTEVNDSVAEARALADFAGATAAHINLLPFHPFPGAAYPPTAQENLRRFKRRIEEAGYLGEVTIRRSRGLDIQGACGQLALHAKSPPRAG